MKKHYTIIYIFILCFIPCIIFANDEPLKIKAASAIIIDQKTETILFQKNPYKKHFPASTTKILTAALGIIHGQPSDSITVSKKAAYSIERGSSSIALKPGEIITLKDALYALMLRSANECGNIIAEYIKGGNEEFALLMNEKSLELGCKNSNFSNPHGLHDKNHYTCAYDLALIAKFAYDLPLFREIVSTKFYTFPTTNKHKSSERGDLRNKNSMLHKSSKYFSPYCTGIKAGFTKNALHTFVASAEKDGNCVIAAVLKESSKSEMYNELISMLEYGLNQFRKETFFDNETIVDTIKIKESNKKLIIITGEKIELTLPIGFSKDKITKKIVLNSISLPIRKKDSVGKLQLFFKDKIFGEFRLIAGNEVLAKFSWENLKKYFISWPFILFCSLLLCFLILIIPSYFDKKKHTLY